MAKGSDLIETVASLDIISQAFDFIVNGREAVGGGVQVGGPHQVFELATKQLEVTLLALAVSILIAMPAGLLLGHYGRGE